MYQQDRTQLADKLKTLRVAAGLSGARLAERLGWNQSKVSRIETAKQLPTDDDLAVWVGHLDADHMLDDLSEQLRRARVEYTAWKEHFPSGGSAAVQAAILEMEATATTICEFQPSMISGLVQTAEYARELLHQPSGPAAYGASEEEIATMIPVRMQRQQVLYDPEKRIRLVILEAALYTRVCSTATHAGQLDRLIGLTGLPSLELGIVPFQVVVPVFPLSGFRLYDADVVLIESIGGEQHLTSEDEIGRYARFFDLLDGAAKHGPEATRIIQRALADIQATAGGG